MVGITNMEPFEVLSDTRPDDRSLPAFMVSISRGFLPRQDPVDALPLEFDAVESLLQRMPIKKANGEPGLLAKSALGEAVVQELPDLSDAIELYRNDLPLMTAIYRDYSFLASAYLLEPCHERFMQGLPYGLGRQSLPSNISRPIAKVAEMYVYRRCFLLPWTNLPATESASSHSWSTPAHMHSSTIGLLSRAEGSSIPISVSSEPLNMALTRSLQRQASFWCTLPWSSIQDPWWLAPRSHCRRVPPTTGSRSIMAWVKLSKP